MVISTKHREFLIGLEKLTRKTGVKVRGCGCCSSPYLFDLRTNEEELGAGYALDGDGEVIWVSESDTIAFNLYSKKVIKR